jgi:putative endonuclease
MITLGDVISVVAPAKAGVQGYKLDVALDSRFRGNDEVEVGNIVPMRRPCVYILASQRNGTLYVGVTSNLTQRIEQHRADAVPSFTERYNVHRLVYAEFHETMPDAILREKQMKKWRRAWKLQLIERDNPEWRDLAHDIAD